WGGRPRDWAELAEPQNVPLFAAVLDRVGTGALLDAGCGSGLAAQMAAERGASVSGLDATEALLAIAGERVPDGDFRAGALEELPWDDGSFDAVVGFNSFQFAADPVAALRAAARVVRVGGLVAATTFAEPERCESTALHLAMKALMPPEVASGYVPYALSAPGGLEELLAAAGLEPVEAGEVPVTWGHGDAETTIRSLLCSAGGARTMAVAGEAAVRAALADAIVPFTQDDGSISMDNIFRFAIGRRSA
ncbi:MAG: type 11 methyltransferase, partial [Conexibacter sp.]|nr:type 11 methyltransferase [Conexibacter sp.]